MKQMIERINEFLSIKSDLAKKWEEFFSSTQISFIKPLQGDTANNWLNVIRLKTRQERDYFIEATNNEGVMTRPVWTLMSKLKMFDDCQNDGLKISQALEDTLVNLPSSVPGRSLSAI